MPPAHITLTEAVLHTVCALVVWLVAMGWAMARVERRPGALRDAALLGCGLFVLAVLLGQPLWFTTDSTNDLALAQACLVRSDCPAIGALASHGSYEGGVLWDWTLAALMWVSDSPRWLLAAFTGFHALAGAGLTVLARDRRTAMLSGLVYFVAAYALSPVFIAWHPTLAAPAAMPFVLLACAPADEQPGRRFATHALIGAAYAVALAMYIASLFLFPLVLAVLLRLRRLRDAIALGVAFVATEALVTPQAAGYNAESVEMDAIGIGVVALLLAFAFRKWLRRWLTSRPFGVGAVSIVGAIVVGGLVTGNALWPYYFALAVPAFAGLVVEIATVSRRPRLEAWSLGVFLTLGLVGATVMYSIAVPRYHEGRFCFRDMYDVAPHYRGGYGAAVTTPSFAFEYSLRLWGGPPVPGDEVGIGLARPEEASTLVCDELHYSRSGEIGICEYETWVRSRGATICDIRSGSTRCRTFGERRDYELPLERSPINYRGEEGEALVVDFRVEVCPNPEHGARVLRPLVYTGLPNRRPVTIVEAPRDGRLSADRSELVVVPTSTACFELHFRWDASEETLAPWVERRLEKDIFEQLVFSVEERRPDAQFEAASSED